MYYIYRTFYIFNNLFAHLSMRQIKIINEPPTRMLFKANKPENNEFSWSDPTELTTMIKYIIISDVGRTNLLHVVNNL